MRQISTGSILIVIGVLAIGVAATMLFFEMTNSPSGANDRPTAISRVSATQTATSTPSREASSTSPATSTPTAEPSSSPAPATSTQPSGEPEPAVQQIDILLPTPEPTFQSATPTLANEPDEAPTATSTEPPPEPAPNVEETGSVITRVTLPDAGVDTDVVEIGYQLIEIEGQTVIQWDVAEWAAGHHSLSANPGAGSNVVVAAHVAGYGDVFMNLEYAEIGDEIIVSTTEGEYRYEVSETHLRLEEGAPLEERLEIGAFMEPTADEQLTLITCWPLGVYDHRLIVIAEPLFD